VPAPAEPSPHPSVTLPNKPAVVGDAHRIVEIFGRLPEAGQLLACHLVVALIRAGEVRQEANFQRRRLQALDSFQSRREVFRAEAEPVSCRCRS